MKQGQKSTQPSLQELHTARQQLVRRQSLTHLQVCRERGYHFDHNVLTMATSLADKAAIAIENARLFQKAQAHATQ